MYLPTLLPHKTQNQNETKQKWEKVALLNKQSNNQAHLLPSETQCMSLPCSVADDTNVKSCFNKLTSSLGNFQEQEDLFPVQIYPSVLLGAGCFSRHIYKTTE